MIFFDTEIFCSDDVMGYDPLYTYILLFKKTCLLASSFAYGLMIFEKRD